MTRWFSGIRGADFHPLLQVRQKDHVGDRVLQGLVVAPGQGARQLAVRAVQIHLERKGRDEYT